MLPSVLSTSLRRRLFCQLIVSGLLLSAALAGLFLLARRLGGVAQASDYLYPLLGILLALVVLVVGRFVERYGAEVLAQDYVQELRQRVLVHALNLPSRHNARITKGGTLLRLTGDMGAIRNWIVQGLAPMVVLGTWLAASLMALTLLHWSLALSVVLPLLLSAVVNYSLGRILYRVSEEAREKRARMIRNVSEKLAAIDVIRLFNQLGREQRRFERQGNRLRNALNRRARTSGMLRGANEAMVLITLVFLVLTGQTLVSRSLITASDFSLILIAAIYLLANLRRLSRVYELWTLNRVATDKLERFLSLKSHPSRRSGHGLKRKRRGPLTLVGAEVPKRLPPVNATFGVQDRIVLSGPGGSGKSTLLRLLAGLEPDTVGRVEKAGTPQNRLDPKVWSKSVSLVSNDLPLLRGTVSSNLFYGRRGYEENYYQEVLQLCGLEWSIENGLSLDTKVLEAGANLPSSDRYRLMLARALLRRPEYLLIDSHEAHLDAAILYILIKVLDCYPGGVLLCTNLPELKAHCTQHWQLTADHQFSAVRIPAGDKKPEGGRVYAV
ncbi:ABC transporter transmembrane domain-containing protein [Marinobacterium sp. YM272]|uniref:ABC transporter transmembrane domain-containing protein n=1 Tax=Marinobacterium sp. YM272 TaxID=3421654 RepID=UPI003D7F2F04